VQKTGQIVPELAGSAPKPPGSVPKKSTDAQKNGSLESQTPQTLDDHDLWEEARQQETLARLIIKVTVATARDAMTAKDWEKVPAELRRRIDRLSQGPEAGNVAESLAPASAGTIAWRQALRRYVRHATQVEPIFQRPPRRFPHLVGIIPGMVHRPTKARVMAVVDTSGSIGTDALEQISAELELMSRSHDVTVVECDAAIHAIYPLTNKLTTVHGRGGTDLRPPFQPAVMSKVTPDVIVYFTDGAGPAPTNQPRVPVIWCLTANGERPAAWGRVIHMLDAEQSK
jgi:predicted metal-dependent peptidase